MSDNVAQLSHLIWLHDHALRATHPVFRAAPLDTPAIFVWDDEALRQAGWSLKRLVFLYETLVEMAQVVPLTVVRGETVAVLKAQAAQQIVVPDANDPAVQHVVKQLGPRAVVVPDEPFVVLRKVEDLKRFFRYWSRAERAAMQQDGGVDGQGRQ